jgi:5-methylcytosine-specific restriction endonuclease McrA
MYGLEVCKSLNLPKSFLQRAHDIRIKYNPNASTILTDKTSHYNKKKIVGMCEMCNEERSTEVHHLAHQKNASMKNDYIDSFHKNHPANLMSICESCHKKFHDSDNNVNHRLKKTMSGQTIVVISS